MDVASLLSFLDRGGVVIWAISALSLFTLTLIFWKALRLARLGVWGGGKAERAVEEFRRTGQIPGEAGGGLRYRIARHGMQAVSNPAFGDPEAREETERFARQLLVEARSGLRALDVVATVAPLLGLLGTVLGMIEAFQALQESGARADPSALAGGIWEALLTTAAGMAVAIPAALALAWFESLVDRVSADVEDLATQVFLAKPRMAERAAE
ncbi:MotA/TolQ/ExbB proton channel family protein [Silicimonas sp. MF1-12-2]|uniref:MotA/TolQ/ExbB proton channel family protein n=1 Tax=Silicimonas sp. MF1-12-2 TaxID=3384793 RepID=UPI0039B40A94